MVKQEFHWRDIEERKATTRGILDDQPMVAGILSR
jgi:hypothetical protein